MGNKVNKEAIDDMSPRSNRVNSEESKKAVLIL
jgi:hypothetical protein